MKPPIVINDSSQISASGDLGVYASIELAEKSLECYDADDDQIHAFDSQGMLLRIVANQGWPRGGAHLEPAEATPQHRTILITILKDFLVRLGEPPERVESSELESLIAATYERAPNPYTGQ